MVGCGVLRVHVGYFIAPCPVMYVDSGDVLALIAGIAIVISLAVIANPQYLFGLQISREGLVNPAETSVKPQISTILTPENPEQIPVVTPVLPKPDALPSRIFYTDKPFTYPVYKMPDHMETFGASEIPWRTNEWVPFAFIENTRGGLTQVFFVPYPIWEINTTVVAEHHPQYSNLRLVLCYADTGGVIEGEEILNQGTSYRVVQTSNVDMYMIITADSVDRFRITLETPRGYYDKYRPQ